MQVSKYAANQVYEAIFQDTFFEPEQELDNIVVPNISVKLGKPLAQGRVARIQEVTFGKYSFIGKVFREGQIMKAQWEYHLLVTINESFMPFPVGVE
jgi:hypothetical protein